MSFWSNLLKFPGTWIVVAVLVGLEAAVLSWFPPRPAFVGLFVGMGLVLLAIWPVLYRRSANWGNAISTARKQLDAATVDRIQSLEADLKRLGAEQAVSQLRGLREKLLGVTGVLEQRLNAGEMTFGRYLGMAEQVYLSAVDNLHEVAVSLTSVSSIDVGYIDKRLAQLGDSGGQETERETLLERRALALQQHDKVERLMAQNETAMTALANTAAALADVRTEQGHASLDADTAMSELTSLAARAKSFDVRR